MRAADKLIQVAEQAVNLATEILRTQPVGQVTGKGDRDMASNVDFAIERQVRSFLADRTPSIGLLGEEEGLSGPEGGELVWALDPIDGTANFLHGLPLCAVSLALIENRRPTLGVIALPYLRSRYWAIEGQGAYSGNRKLKARDSLSLTESIVSIGDYAVGNFAPEKNKSRFLITERLASQVQRIRMVGSAAIDLAWVADGLLDASVMLSNNPWDTAAGVIIAREAGACVVDVYGRPHSWESTETIAVSQALLRPLLEMLMPGSCEAGASRT